MEYTTKEFANELTCSVRTLEDWRSKRSMKLLPARYDGRKAIYTSEQIPIAKALLGRIGENLPMESLFGGQGGEGIANAHEQAAPMNATQEKNFSQDTCGDSSGEYTADETPQNFQSTFDTPAHAEDNHFDELNHSADVDSEHVDDKSTALIIAQNKLPTRIEDVAKFALIGRDRLRAVYAEISALDKIGVVEEVRKQKLEEGQRIGELVLLAEARLGELLNQMPKATTNHKRQKLEIPSAGKFLNDESESVEIPSAKKQSGMKKPSKLEAAAELGFGKNQVSQFQKLADNPAAVQKAIADAKTRGEIVTRAFALNMIKKAERKGKENRQEQKREENTQKIEKLATPLDAQGLFQTIVIDPPWDWGDEGDVNQFGRAKPEYSTMPFDEIKNLPVNKIADVNCHLYLWVTNRSLPKAFALIDAWGFRYITCLTWCKPSIGMGNYFRGSTEQILFAVKGSQPLKRHDVGTYFTAPRGEGHSAKPDEFYRLVESCSYAPFIDIFGRKARDGWSVWGENGGDKKIMLANGAGGKEQ